jgi:hypothetical protein
MAKRKPKFDRRLLGTWKSDRRKTFRHYVPHPDAKPEGLRKFRAIFGKLVVRWTQLRCHTEYDGSRSSEPYEFIASDSESVVVRCFHELSNSYRLYQLHFDEQYYWIWAYGIREYFRRVA